MKNLELRKDMSGRSLDWVALALVVLICCAAIAAVAFAISKLAWLINENPVSVLAGLGTVVLVAAALSAGVWAVNRVFRGK